MNNAYLSVVMALVATSLLQSCSAQDHATPASSQSEADTTAQVQKSEDEWREALPHMVKSASPHVLTVAPAHVCVGQMFF